MKNYKAIIFDLDGTLLDTSEGIYNAVRHTEKAMGLTPVANERLSEYVGPPTLHSYKKHYTLDETAAQQAVIHHRKYQGERGVYEAVPYDGILALLSMLRESGHFLGVATLKRQDITESTLAAADMLERFDAVHGIDMAETLTKSDIINLVLKDLGLNASDAVMIGDSPYDALGAKESGVDFIGVAYGFGFKSTLEIGPYHPIFIANFVDDLIEYFDLHA